MKRFIIGCFLLCVIWIFSAPRVYAQNGVFIGFGAEANGNTFEGAAAVGGGWSFGVDLNRYIALGIKTTFSYDFDSTMATVEQAGLFRFYLPLKIRGPFLQAEAGGGIVFEDKENYFCFAGGIAAGWRIGIGKNLYVEPAGRFGYPFIWGAGISIGAFIQ